MRIIFIGCVQSSYVFFQRVCQLPNIDIAGIITMHQSAFNADFYSLETSAEKLQVPCLLAEQCTLEEMVVWCRARRADVIYCFGWSRLLPREILQLCPLGVIGYHPAPLPANRGRHPVIWSLALGLKTTASTFFFMDEAADHGDILSQAEVPIDDADDAGTLYHKLLAVGVEQLADFTQQLVCRDYRRIPQDHAKANSWRKRGEADGKIDWRMPARGIYNLVRALTTPYVGAHFMYEHKKIKVWRTRIISEIPLYENLEPGLVLEKKGKKIQVQCGLGVIQLIEYDAETDIAEGTYLCDE